MTLTRSLREPKPKRCAYCRVEFPRNGMVSWCSLDCAIAIALKKLAAKKAKEQRAERVADRARKVVLKSRSDHMKAAQVAFNAWVRQRDEDQPCICCGRNPKFDHLTGGSWDAGHYRSIGSAPHLRFEELNCHRQMKHCNRDGAGRAVDYRIGLIARIGLAAVEELEADQEPRRYTIDELIAIKVLYRLKLKQLKGASDGS